MGLQGFILQAKLDGISDILIGEYFMFRARSTCVALNVVRRVSRTRSMIPDRLSLCLMLFNQQQHLCVLKTTGDFHYIENLANAILEFY